MTSLWCSRNQYETSLVSGSGQTGCFSLFFHHQVDWWAGFASQLSTAPAKSSSQVSYRKFFPGSQKSVRVTSCCNLSQLFLSTLILPLLCRRSLTASATCSVSCDSPSLFCLIYVVKSKTRNCATHRLRLLEILQPWHMVCDSPWEDSSTSYCFCTMILNSFICSKLPSYFTQHLINTKINQNMFFNIFSNIK